MRDLTLKRKWVTSCTEKRGKEKRKVHMNEFAGLLAGTVRADLVQLGLCQVENIRNSRVENRKCIHFCGKHSWCR